MIGKASVLICAIAALAMAATEFEIDLGSGNAGGGVVENGQFTSDGWKVTAVKHNRIIFRTSVPITAGTFEADILINASPHSTTTLSDPKLNYFGAYANPAMQHYCTGDKAYARVGQTKYKFSRIKCENGPFVRGTTPEPSVGETSQWKTDGSSVNRVKWTFGPSSDIKFSYQNNSKTLSRRIKNLQYFFVGCDKTYNNACPQMVFTRVKITSTDGTSFTVGSTSIGDSNIRSGDIAPVSSLSVVDANLQYDIDQHSTVRFLMPNGAVYRQADLAKGSGLVSLEDFVPGCYVVSFDGNPRGAQSFTVK